VGALLALGSLQWIKVDFYLGDNPESPYYNLDQIRRLGVRYFWTVTSDYWQGTVPAISLPEQPTDTGRTSIFTVHRFDDGSRGLMFRRNTIGGKADTFSLLSDANLDHLTSTAGRSILYLHWLSKPKSYFGNADAVHGLERLASRKSHIWITSASKLLDQAYAYAYVEYTVSEADHKAIVDISDFRDPIDGRVKATLDRLDNLSFLCRDCAELDIRLNGVVVPAANVLTTKAGGNLVATITSSENGTLAKKGP
jgi:hypothetical protein